MRLYLKEVIEPNKSDNAQLSALRERLATGTESRAYFGISCSINQISIDLVESGMYCLNIVNVRDHRVVDDLGYESN